MHPGRRDYGGGYRDDFRSYGRSAGMRGGYDDVEEEYDDGSSYGFGNGMQSGGSGGRGAEVSNQLNLVAALLAQSLQQQQQNSQPLIGQQPNMLQAAQNLIGRPQQQQYQGFRDNWSSQQGGGNARGFGRSGPSRGGGRGRPGLLGDGLLAYEGPQVGEVPSLLNMPPLRGGRGMWGGGETRQGSKRRSDDWNETESQKRRKETGTSDQSRGQSSKGATPKSTYTPKDKATPTSTPNKAAVVESSTKLQQQANKTPVKSTPPAGASGDVQSGKADASKKAAAAALVTIKKDAPAVQPGSVDVSAAAAAALVYQQGKAYGAEYVVPVTGYFCKLCHKFYSNVTAATVAHCQSEQHFEKYKSALIKKAKAQGTVEPAAAAEGNLDEVTQVASSSASASNVAEEEVERQPAINDDTADVKPEEEPEESETAAAEVPEESGSDTKAAESDLGIGNAEEQSMSEDAEPSPVDDDKAGLAANADDAASIDAPAAAECATPVGKSKLAAEADLDVSAVGSLNESVDEAIEDSPAATGRARRGRGRAPTARRGRK